MPDQSDARGKLKERSIEVRYRISSSGTGWDKCAVDAAWVQ
jgi:hypothetical protein